MRKTQIETHHFMRLLKAVIFHRLKLASAFVRASRGPLIGSSFCNKRKCKRMKQELIVLIIFSHSPAFIREAASNKQLFRQKNIDSNQFQIETFNLCAISLKWKRINKSIWYQLSFGNLLCENEFHIPISCFV